MIFNQNWYVSSLGCWAKLSISYHCPCICYIFLLYQGSQYVIRDVRSKLQRHEGYESLWGMMKWHRALWRNMMRKWCLCLYRFWEDNYKFWEFFTSTHGAPTSFIFVLTFDKQKHCYEVSMWQIHMAMMTWEFLLTWWNTLLLRYILTCHKNPSRNILVDMDEILLAYAFWSCSQAHIFTHMLTK
jgi:hypothetical protein